jgi:photosystem II stability/assembly factor-like uncharacterized protein
LVKRPVDACTLTAKSTESSGWVPQPVPAAVDQALLDVFFLDDLEGWAVGFDGNVIHTVNGGSSWSLLPKVYVDPGMTEPAVLWGVYFLDASSGFLAGEDVLRYTVDGGQHWQDAVLNPPGPFDEYYAFDFIVEGAAIRGVVTAEPGKALYTNDGITWTQARLRDPSGQPTTLALDFEPWDVQFTPGQTSIATAEGFFVGGLFNGGGRIFRTNDGGVTWQEEPPATPFELGTMYGLTVWAGGEAVTVGYGGQINKRDPNTRTWNDHGPAGPLQPCNLNGPFTAPIVGLDGDDQGNNLWAVGSFGYLRKSTDGGISFQPEITNGGAIWRLSDTYFSSATEGWICGQMSIAHTLDGAETFAGELCGAGGGGGLTLNLTGIDFSATGAGVAVGSSAPNAYARAAGPPASWIPAAGMPVTSGLNDVRWLSGSTFYAVGAQGVLLRSTDDGAHWTQLTGAPDDPSLPGQPVLNGLTFLSPANAFVVGREGGVGKAYRVQSIGTSSPLWFDTSPAVASDAGPDLRSVDARGVLSNPEVYAVGEGGAFLKWHRNLDRFEPESTNLSLPDMSAVIAVDNGTDIFLGGFEGALYHYDGGGVLTKIKSETNNQIRAFAFVDPSHGFAVSSLGQIIGDSAVIAFRP